MPTASRTYPFEVVTRALGIAPSLTARRSPYTSAMNASTARTRCREPDSTDAHSWPELICSEIHVGRGVAQA
ncbi:MAG: hypothetical protein OEM67_03835 [Thermoleophilia bacterium]|nr:hypothetical protein [Thermoleophilia bacterium]